MGSPYSYKMVLYRNQDDYRTHKDQVVVSATDSGMLITLLERLMVKHGDGLALVFFGLSKIEERAACEHCLNKSTS